MRAALLYLLPPAAVLAVVASTFAAATRPILHHVEYAGLIPAVERLAGEFGDRDLLLVEPRYSSDTHVLATPLAYIYGKHVLLFSSPRPGRAEVGQFLAWASRTYDRVFLLAEGGFDLASASIGITPVRNEQFSIPEYESARNAYPREIRRKKFNLNVYQLQPVERAAPVLDLDIGGYDDPWVLRMFARQEQEGVTYRWARDRSFVTVIGFPASARAIVIRAGDGGRPAAAGPASVQVFLNDRAIGAFTVRGGFADTASTCPRRSPWTPRRARPPPSCALQCTTWAPKDFLGGSDDRPLGIMLDRVRVAVDTCCRLPIPVNARPSRRPTPPSASRARRAAGVPGRLRPTSGASSCSASSASATCSCRCPPFTPSASGRPTRPIHLVVGRWNEALARHIAGIDAVETMDAPWLARGRGGRRVARVAPPGARLARAAVRSGHQPRGRHPQQPPHEPGRRTMVRRLRDGGRRPAAR